MNTRPYSMSRGYSQISHSCPDIGDDEIQALVACARSLQLKGDERILSLERQVADDLH